MRLLSIALLLLLAACDADTAPPPNASLAPPDQAEPIGPPSTVVKCGGLEASKADEGASSDAPACTPEDIASAIDKAKAELTSSLTSACEAKIQTAVDDVLAEVSSSYPARDEVLDAGEYAGMDVRMVLGIQMCNTFALMSSLPEGSYVYLRRMEPGLSNCSDSCEAQGCTKLESETGVQGQPNHTGSTKGLIYVPKHLQWVSRPANAPEPYCCCVHNAANTSSACKDHELD